MRIFGNNFAQRYFRYDDILMVALEVKNYSFWPYHASELPQKNLKGSNN